MNTLERIVESTRQDVAVRRRALPESELELALADRSEARPWREALAHPGVSVIAEFKRRSPSAGTIREGATVEGIVQSYEQAGAAALSVLTEERSFGGAIGDLVAARAASALPVLRKDFIVESYQVLESAAAGADAILLIVAALDDERLAALHAQALAFDLDVLVEVHDAPELERALEAIDPDVIGINNRNLADLSVDVGRTFELLADVPAGKTVVSESGLHTRQQLLDLEEVGVDAALIGESLMRAPDPGMALQALVADPGSNVR